MFCPQCGENNADGVQFCKSCGRQLKAAPTPGMPAPGTPGGFQRPAGVGGVPGLGATNDLMRFVLPVGSVILALLLFFCPWGAVKLLGVGAEVSLFTEMTEFMGAISLLGSYSWIAVLILIFFLAMLLGILLMLAGSARILMNQPTLTNQLVMAGAGISAVTVLVHIIFLFIGDAVISGMSYGITKGMLAPAGWSWFLLIVSAIFAYYAFTQYKKAGR